MSKVSSKYCIGYKYVNKQGLDVEVVEYRGRKDITVEFKLDGIRKTTTGSYIKKLLPLHPTFDKSYVGQKFKCHDGDMVEIVEILKNSMVKVRWISDGFEAIRLTHDIRKEFNRHPIKNKPKEGEIFTSKRFGNVRVLKYNSAIDVLVEFEDGISTSVPVSRLKTGNFKHPMCGLKIGQEFVTNSGWKCQVIGYKGTHEVEVLWQDGSNSTETKANLEAGAVKPLFQPSVENIGYFGKGRFSPYSKNELQNKIYGYWVRMFVRCYNPFELNKDKNQSYRDIHICKEWYNFSNFAGWALLQNNSKDYSFELDKDLLSKGVKIYSPDSCCFIPEEINLFLLQQDKGTYYRGVHVIKPKQDNHKTGYVARCCTGNGREYLGFFNTPEEAFYAYKQRKESYAKELAEKWKSQIDSRAYEALINYRVDITD